MTHDPPPSVRLPGLVSRFLVRLAGADIDTLSRCPAGDWDDVHVTGLLMCFTAAYLTGLFFLIGHHLFGAPWPVPLGIAAFLACLIILIETQLVVRPSWFQKGVEALRMGGLEVEVASSRVKVWIGVGIRSLMAIDFAQLSALIVALMLFAPDIATRQQADWRRENAALIASVTAMVDARVASAADAVDVARKRIDTLVAQITALRQNEIDPSASDVEGRQAQQEIARLTDEQTKAEADVAAAETFASNELAGIKGSAENSGHAGQGPKRRAAVEHAANARQHLQTLTDGLAAARNRLSMSRQRGASTADTARKQAAMQLPAFEARLAEENATLARLQDDVTRAADGREGAIRKALEASPDYVPLKSGLLGQLAALDAIAHENPRVAALILIVDLASLCLELGVVASRSLGHAPSTYARLVAGEAILQAVRAADRMVIVDEGDARSKHWNDSARALLLGIILLTLLLPEQERSLVAVRQFLTLTHPRLRGQGWFGRR